MLEIIAITKCIKRSPVRASQEKAWFHFIGVWKGHVIRKICLEIHKDTYSVYEGEEYIILLCPLKVTGGTLHGRIKKISPLSSFEYLE